MKKRNKYIKDTHNWFLEFYIKLSIIVSIFYIIDAYKMNIFIPLNNFSESLFLIMNSILTLILIIGSLFYIISSIYSVIKFTKLKLDTITLVVPTVHIFLFFLGLITSLIYFYNPTQILSYFMYIQIAVYTFIILFSMHLLNKFGFQKERKTSIEIVVILVYLTFILISSILSLFNPESNLSQTINIFILMLIILSIYIIIKHKRLYYNFIFICLILLMLGYIISSVTFLMNINEQIELLKMSIGSSFTISKEFLIVNNIFSLIFQLFFFSLIMWYIKKEKKYFNKK